MISIILAGGAGTRLWPLSRKYWPKFLLKLADDKFSLLQKTFLRVKEFSSLEKIFIVVNKEHKFLVKENIQDLKINFPLENIITEPEIRNTLPAVTLGCEIVKNKYPKEKIVGIFPSDHIIKPNKRFKNYIEEAKRVALKENIILFGIKPTRVESGYGHIKIRKDSKYEFENFYKVESFIEKPEFNVAKKLLKSSDIYWNSGIFVFHIDTFFDELKIYQPYIYELLVNSAYKSEDLKNIYEKITPLSIDKGLIEKTKKLLFIPLENIFWDDLGSWGSLERIYKKDENNNIIFGKNIDISSKNIKVLGSDKRLIATCGLENLIIVDTEDALLVLNKNYDQKVKDIVEKIVDETKLYHKTVQRPWGFYTVLKQSDGYKIKIINVLPQKRLSLQKHKKRAEQWFVVCGVAKIFCKDKFLYLRKGETLKIEKNMPHRLENPSKKQILEIVEVGYGSYLGEDDIIRLEDDFKRK